MKLIPGIICMAVTGMLSGCIGTDSAVFVTKSSIGIDVETKPPQVSLAYDRTEGFFGPRYEDGSIPPVIASIRTDGGIFDPRVKQVYATGAAANILADPAQPVRSNTLSASAAKPMFFGTSTTLGFKVSFGTDTKLPESVTFGYKRKEASFIPIGLLNGQHHYPSVLAAIDSESTFKKLDQTGVESVQFFATGFAAESLAREPVLRELLIQRAAEAVADAGPELTKALATLADTDTKADAVAACVSNADGSIDTAKLTELVSAVPGISLAARNDMVRATTRDNLAEALKDNYDTAVPVLFTGINADTCVPQN